MRIWWCPRGFLQLSSVAIIRGDLRTIPKSWGKKRLDVYSASVHKHRTLFELSGFSASKKLTIVGTMARKAIRGNGSNDIGTVTERTAIPELETARDMMRMLRRLPAGSRKLVVQFCLDFLDEVELPPAESRAEPLL